jgi:arabinose-5-phosphate isomerase
MKFNKKEIGWLEIARKALMTEADAIWKSAERLDKNFITAVKLILDHPGKVVVSGVGKSGHVGQKIVATLCSTGTQAVFLNAVEAVHGDLGIYTPGDPTILISKSGATGEMIRLVPILRRFESKLIAIVGNLNSPLAQQADIVLDARINQEVDALGVVPTSSTTVALALGDALAAALISARRFTEKDFARFHPGGQLGRNLELLVSDVMHKNDSVAWVKVKDHLRKVVQAMTEKPLGAACVLGENGLLAGLITDGDLRRVMLNYDDIGKLCAQDIMTHNPVTVSPEMTLQEALHLMEDRPSQISVLPVVENSTKKCLGLLRLHDIHLPVLY